MVRRRLTSIGKLFLGLMFLFYVASVTSQSGLLLLLIGLLAGCFIVNWSFATRNARYLKVTPPLDVYLVEGETPTQPWKFENPISKHAEVMEILHGDQVLFRLPVVKTHEALSAVPQLKYERRGVYPNAQVTICSAAPYGLIRASKQTRLPGDVVVFPRVYEVESPAATGVEMISGGRSRGGRRVNTGAHFAGVRAWQAGDSLKQVHWNTTARRGELMVKTFEEELGGRVSLVLNCGPAELSVVDNAVRAAGSLGVATLQAGHQLEFIDLTDAPVLRFAAFSDEGEFLERLARYEVPTNSQLPHASGIWRRSTVGLIGTVWKEEWRAWIDEVRGLNRLVQLYLPMAAPAPTNLDVEIFNYSGGEIWLRLEGAKEQGVGL
jgi:uncharacterized protein (DUF58 family)